MIEKLKTLSADTKETAGLLRGTEVTISAQQHARMHFAVRDLQLKLNEVIEVLNSMENQND